MINIIDSPYISEHAFPEDGGSGRYRYTFWGSPEQIMCGGDDFCCEVFYLRADRRAKRIKNAYIVL